jgi:hypothetical protein
MRGFAQVYKEALRMGCGRRRATALALESVKAEMDRRAAVDAIIDDLVAKGVFEGGLTRVENKHE